VSRQPQILAVSIDTHEESKKLRELLAQEPLGPTPSGTTGGQGVAGRGDFPLLEDQHHQVIDRYGLLNPEGKGWPHPATYVIDREGIVRWKFVEVNYKVRATNDMILNALQALP
jgi:alkyl hydroperoxide reductase subunit AhpC